jgi:O-acetyl-ADP-ribose deacetylase (regulator of RNase III)
MRVSILVGDLTEAPAEVVCTSTNPRLSLMMGTGGAVRERGGFQVLRACEEIVEGEFRRSGLPVLPAGSAHATTAGNLPYKAIVHCVASDASHRSSAEIIRLCVKNALACADAAACSSVAMPLFATGHAGFKFERALLAMAEALRDASTAVKHVIIVIDQPHRAEDAHRLLCGVIPDAELVGE